MTTAYTRALSFLVVNFLIATVVAVGLVSLAGAADYAIAGLSDPGVVTRYGVVVAKVVADAAAVVCIGALLQVAFLVPPQKSGTVAPDGYAGLRVALLAAWSWFAGALASMYFSAADGAGRPVAEVLAPAGLLELLDVIEQPKAWLITALIALMVAVGCHLTLAWKWSAVLFFVALAGLVPIAVTGHSAAGGAHDVATNSLLYHVAGAALWVGGLVAILGLGWRGSPHLGLATRRYSKLALICWIVMAASGAINALVRIAPADLLTSDYGLLLIGKIAALLILGVFGHQQRRHGIRAVSDGAGSGRLVQLAVVEILIMFVTVGVAVALSRTPPPQESAVNPTRMEVLIGYNLGGPPTVARLLFDWRFDLIYGILPLVLAGLYLAGVRRLRRRGIQWPWGRTAAWLAGCFMLLIATSSGIGRYAPAMFSVHMVAHMLLTMIVPVLLVLGGPVTLALRAIPPARQDNPPGAREWLLALVHSRLTRVLTHPVVALALFVSSFYGLYFSDLFSAALDDHWAHLAMNAHFLLTGYLFYWVAIGIDPAPRRLPAVGRLGLVFAALPFHAFFGVAMMNRQTVLGSLFYEQLALPWVPNLLADQRLGGGLAWAGGELPVFVVLVALFIQWSRSDAREARRLDRREEASGDADLAAYNAMLKQLSGRRESGR
ncbi:cytochrome c oxidase assembly protein [Amycolatopsis tucumanensis]|uniref:Cytochrome c oxidase assembly protein n=1 Tax=Amycolatopsis tucumanensis TaxID=401106 RepID=A0ABP7JX31_9PSEU|nr:cytochrome c oxidase assembly protein [Amycolatopsis tucumanensis]MCF6429123.1 bifunctional copper resistance protein CopD/cytochrome c oxidase assembly protein [Amycolatopsis tucumanensis]